MKWKEPVGRLEFHQLPLCAGPGLRLLFPIPRFRRRQTAGVTAEYKRLILRETEVCKERGQVGALLRREGLYSSNLTAWRHQVERGTLDALSSKKRGPKARKPDPSVRRITEQEKEIQKLRARLRKAELIIDAQKKIAEIFQLPRDQKEEEDL